MKPIIEHQLVKMWRVQMNVVAGFVCKANKLDPPRQHINHIGKSFYMNVSRRVFPQPRYTAHRQYTLRLLT